MTLRLSDAIALGRTLEAPGYGHSYCDCAIGLGMAAMGIPKDERQKFRHREIWPWLAENRLFPDPGHIWPCDMQISYWFLEVSHGLLTLDQVIDLVRSIEPAEESEEWKPLCQYTDDERRLLDMEHRCGVDDREG